MHSKEHIDSPDWVNAHSIPDLAWRVIEILEGGGQLKTVTLGDIYWELSSLLSNTQDRLPVFNLLEKLTVEEAILLSKYLKQKLFDLQKIFHLLGPNNYLPESVSVELQVIKDICECLLNLEIDIMTTSGGFWVKSFIDTLYTIDEGEEDNPNWISSLPANVLDETFEILTILWSLYKFLNWSDFEVNYSINHYDEDGEALPEVVWVTYSMPDFLELLRNPHSFQK